MIRLVVGGGFEPPKAKASRFTVCPRWPLEYPTVIVYSGTNTDEKMEPVMGLEPATC